MTVNEEYGVEVGRNSISFMLSSAKVCRVVRELKVEGNRETDADYVFILCGVFYLSGNVGLQRVHLKRQCTCTRLHGFTCRKTSS
jgi:hypothetical protein